MEGAGGDPVLHVPGGTDCFCHKSQTNCSRPEKKKSKPKQTNETTSYAPVPFEISYPFYYEPLIQVAYLLRICVILLLTDFRFLGPPLFAKKTGFSCCFFFWKMTLKFS